MNCWSKQERPHELHLYVAGGAVIANKTDSRLTGDVDVVSEGMTPQLRAAVKEVSQRHRGLRPDWLNDGAKLKRVNIALEPERIFTGRRLIVDSAGDRYVLAMKLVSHRQVDEADCEMLIRALGIRNLAELLDLIEQAIARATPKPRCGLFRRRPARQRVPLQARTPTIRRRPFPVDESTASRAQQVAVLAGHHIALDTSHGSALLGRGRCLSFAEAQPVELRAGRRQASLGDGVRCVSGGVRSPAFTCVRQRSRALGIVVVATVPKKEGTAQMTDLAGTSPHSCARPVASAPRCPRLWCTGWSWGPWGLLDQPASRSCVCAVDALRCGSRTSPQRSVQQHAEAGSIHSGVAASNSDTQHHSRAAARHDVPCWHNKPPGCTVAHRSPHRPRL